MSVAKSIKPHISFLLALPSVIKTCQRRKFQNTPANLIRVLEKQPCCSWLWKFAQVDMRYMSFVVVVGVAQVVVARMVERMLVSVVSVEELVLSA